MIRKLAVLTVFSVSTLFVTSMICADQAGMADGVFPRVNSNDKLLINRIVSQNQSAFEQGMADAGWDIHKPHNLLFYNVRQIIGKNDIMSLQAEIDKKLTSQIHTSRAVNSGA